MHRVFSDPGFLHPKKDRNAFVGLNPKREDIALARYIVGGIDNVFKIHRYLCAILLKRLAGRKFDRHSFKAAPLETCGQREKSLRLRADINTFHLRKAPIVSASYFLYLGT